MINKCCPTNSISAVRKIKFTPCLILNSLKQRDSLYFYYQNCPLGVYILQTNIPWYQNDIIGLIKPFTFDITKIIFNYKNTCLLLFINVLCLVL